MNKQLFLVVFGIALGMLIAFLFEQKHIREYHSEQKKVGSNLLDSNDDEVISVEEIVESIIGDSNIPKG